jgi:hypothetical protein
MGRGIPPSLCAWNSTARAGNKNVRIFQIADFRLEAAKTLTTRVNLQSAI